MRKPLSELNGRRYDVAVIGAGANGASTAQHLAAAGYEVLAIDKGDFASGASGRSSRLLHCGLRYLAPGGSMWDFVRSPNKLAVAMRMAKKAMEARAQIVETAPERVEKLHFCFPIYAGGAYAPWQVSMAFRILERLGPQSVPLDYRRVGQSAIGTTPLAKWLRDQERLQGLAVFSEYRYEWAERLVVEAILDAERMGATVRNYTALNGMTRSGNDGWTLSLADALEAEGVTCHVIGGADVAAELDAKRAINQGTRLAATL